MRRLLWLGVGLAVGALVVRAVTKKMNALSPTGIAGSVRQSAVGLADSVRSFVDDVREGMAEREAEIHAAFTDGALLGDQGNQGDPEKEGPEKEGYEYR
jgi:hypothetical protein